MAAIFTKEMQQEHMYNWILGNVGTIFFLTLNNHEAITFAGTVITWIGILALAVFNIVKAIALLQDMKVKKGDKK